METIIALLMALAVGVVLLRIFALPIRLGLKLLLSSGCGFLCLWLLNWAAGLTGIYFPINPVTAAIAGFLGLPGVALLALVALFL